MTGRQRQKWRGVVAVIATALAVAVLTSPSAFALDPREQLKDSKLEERARGLSAELRCLVCQNQSIDDSDAPLAKDLRRLVRERLVLGESDAEVKTHIVARYGDFVLLKPPLNMHTLLLWMTPLLVLLATLAGLWWAYARRRTGSAGSAVAAVLSGDEQRRLDELLRDR